MRIQILTHLNGVGLERDARILERILIDAGHEVYVQCLKKHQNAQRYDLNLHLELIGHQYFTRARKNILIPNPEWFPLPEVRNLNRFTKIFAKTRGCERIFKQYHGGTIFTSFTSEDRYMPEINKIREYAIHAAGKSDGKNTDEILSVYKDHGFDFPKLLVISTKFREGAGNVIMQTDRLEDADLKQLQNTCLFSVCTSKYEGWGHYLWEALSTGGVVVTTNAAPMNEYIQDGVNGFLVKSSVNYPQNLGQMNVLDKNDFHEVMRSLNMMRKNELFEIGKAARETFLNNDKQFKETILNQINSL